MGPARAQSVTQILKPIKTDQNPFNRHNLSLKMTIDSTWIASFKEEIPSAFTKQIPFRPKAAFCDGQIRLMRGHSDEDFLTWDNYIFRQFQSHVQRFYDDHKVTTVILAFDDYGHVPEAKCMTQQKRRRHLPKLDILEREPLPATCPSGERLDQCIANRTFKAKVIAMVIQSLPRLLKLAEGQSLIVDYAGCPDEYRMHQGVLQTRSLSELSPLGEADVKFTRYAELYRDLLVDSVDGDSIPIALLYHESAIADLTGGSMQTEDLSEAPPRICIYRMTTRVADADTKKRKAEPIERADCRAAKPEKAEKDPVKRRTFEYVHIPMLYHALKDIIAQCVGRLQSPSHDAQHMSMLVALIGLTGTDYTRNMPQISGRSLFNFLSDVWLPLMRSYNPMTGQLDVDSATDNLVSCIYACKYATHVGTAPSLHSVLEALHGSKLSQRTRDSLPTVARVQCTARNVNWLIRYWRQPTLVPDPLQNEGGVALYGFVKRRGVVAYAAE